MAFEKIYKTFRIRWKIRAISLEDEFSMMSFLGRNMEVLSVLLSFLFDRSI